MANTRPLRLVHDQDSQPQASSPNYRSRLTTIGVGIGLGAAALAFLFTREAPEVPTCVFSAEEQTVSIPEGEGELTVALAIDGVKQGNGQPGTDVCLDEAQAIINEMNPGQRAVVGAVYVAPESVVLSKG